MGNGRKIKLAVLIVLLFPALFIFAQEMRTFFFTNFSTGEISRKLDTRVDFEKTSSAVRTMQNMNVFPQGGAFKRPGTYYVSGVSDHNKSVRLVPFVYSTEEAYIIEFGDYYARFYKDRGQIYTPDEYTKLLLHCNGTDGLQTFPDTSWLGRTRPIITAYGDTKISTANYQFPSGSASFDGDGDYLLVPDSADYNSSVTPFTLDFWVKFNNVDGTQPFWTSYLSGNSSYVSFYYDGALKKIRVANITNGLTDYGLFTIASWTPVTDTWYHLAFVSGVTGDYKNWLVFVDGQQVAAPVAYTGLNHLSGASSYLGGSTVTISYDLSQYGHAFNFSGGSGVTKPYKFGTGSLYLDGSGDYLSTNDHAAWDISAYMLGNYTISFFVNHVALTGTQTYLSQYQDANNYWVLQKTAGSGVTFGMISGGLPIATMGASSVTPTAGQWDHVAIVRRLSKYGIYINGQQVSYLSDSDSGSIDGLFYIGGLAASNYLNGYMDYLFIVKDNVFSALPNVGLTDTITVPSAYGTITSNVLYLPFDYPYLNGYMDEIRYSSTTRWVTNFTPETDEYPVGDTNAGSVYQITTPYAANHLADLKYTQNDNTLYMAHRHYPPWKLTRTSHDLWTGTTVNFTNNVLVSGSSGYPGCVEFHEQRLIWGGSYNYPQTLWMSKSGEYENLTTGANAADAIFPTLSASSVNAVRWINSSKSLIVGTTGGEWIVGPTSSLESITPSNIQAKRHVTPGTADVQGLKIGTDTIDIQFSGRKVRELSYSYEIEGYKSAELSLLAEHLFTGYTIIQMAYQGEPYNILWCLRNDGMLLGFTYLKDNNIYAWSRFVTNGVIENIAVAPADTGNDELWLQVKRLVNGSYKRYIEYLYDLELDTTTAMFYVDSGLSYSGAAATTLSGLSHLSGCSVAVLGNGAYMGLKTVSSGGTIIVSPAVTSAHVGLQYNSILETIDIPSQLVDKKRVTKIIPNFHKSCYFEYGSNSANAVPYNFRSGITPYTGYLEMPIPGGWGLEKIMYFESDVPLSLIINGLQVNIE